MAGTYSIVSTNPNFTPASEVHAASHDGASDPINVRTYIAEGAISAGDVVVSGTVDSTRAMRSPGVGENTIGVAVTAAVNGAAVVVRVAGYATVIAAGAIQVADYLVSAAAGRATASTPGPGDWTYALGRALTAAADGGSVVVSLHQHIWTGRFFESYTAAGAITAYRVVKHSAGDATQVGIVTGDPDVLGVPVDAAINGESFDVQVAGELMVETAGAITAGSPVQVVAGGRIQQVAYPGVGVETRIVGYALFIAAGAGEIIEINWCPSMLTGGTPPSQFPMGDVYMANNAVATAIAVAGTFYKAAGTTTLGMARSVDMPANNRIRYTGAATRDFHCGATLSVSSAGANDVLQAQLHKNGAAIAGSLVEHKMGGATDVLSTAIHVMVSLATNDYLELFVANATDTDSLTIKHSNVFIMGVPT